MANKEMVTSVRLSKELRKKMKELREGFPLTYHNQTHMIEVALWNLINQEPTPKTQRRYAVMTSWRPFLKVKE